MSDPITNQRPESPANHQFNVLEAIDSTNNYAMQAVHDGRARNGETWFARHQSAGRGQRGRAWTSFPGENVAMSLAWKPSGMNLDRQFLVAAAVANTCLDYLESVSRSGWSLKWPNDLYFDNRKAAGILIENNIRGAEWHFAVIGIGINVNVSAFPPDLPYAVSLRQITGKIYSPEDMARRLSAQVLNTLALLPDASVVLAGYNSRLYRRNEQVSFRSKNGDVFTARIDGVNENGLLQTDRGSLRHGDAEWLLESITADR